MKVRFGRTIVFALIACFAVAIGGATSASAALTAGEKRQVKKIAKKFAGKRGPRGPQGPAGPQGPVGPQGPQGPAGNSSGVSVIPFKFLAIGNTGNTTIATFTGAVAESGCQGGAFSGARIRSTADNGATEVLNLRTAAFGFQPDFDTGESVSLNQGNTDQHGLTYMSAGGTQVVSAHYSAYSGAGIGGQYDCAIFGTAQVG